MALPNLHYITATQAAAYETTGLGLDPAPQDSGCITRTGAAAFFCHYVEETFLNDPSYGATDADRVALWNQGGLTVQTTMSPKDDSARTRRSAKVYASDYRPDGPKGRLGPGAMVQPGTGEIKAIAQSKPMGAGPARPTSTSPPTRSTRR